MVPEHKIPVTDEDGRKTTGEEGTPQASEPHPPVTPEAALNYLAAIDKQRPKEARSTYARLRRCAEDRWEELFALYRAMAPSDVTLLHQWGMLELAHDVSKPRTKVLSRRQAVAGTAPRELAECAAALYTSIHLSSANLSNEIEKALPKRLSLGDARTFLRPWEPGTSGQAEKHECWLSGSPPEGVAAYSNAGARLALEWKVRSDILALSRLGREATHEQLKQHRHGLESLGRLIVAAVEEERRPKDALEASLWRIAQEIVQSIGRQPDVWGAVDKQRLELIQVLPADDWRREKWAWMVASTWAATEGSKAAVGKLAPVQLEPLVETTRRLDMRGLQRIATEALSNAVVQEMASVDTGHDAKTQPDTNSQEPARSPDQGGLARFRLTPPDAQAQHLFQTVRRGDPLKLLARWPWSGLHELDQRSVIPALTEFLGTAENALRERAHAQTQEAQKLLFDTGVSWENALASLRNALGTDIPRMAEAIAVARSNMVHRGLPLAPDHQDTSGHEKTDLTPQRADHAIERLRRLSELTLRDPVKAQDERSSLRRHIAWAIDNDEELQQLIDAGAELPEEALAQMWTAAVGMNSELLMSTVTPFLERREGWAERTWIAALRALAPTLGGPLAASPGLASFTVNLLSARLAQLKEELLSPERETPLDAAKRRITEERSTLLALVESLVRDIGDFKSVIGGQNDGASDRS